MGAERGVQQTLGKQSLLNGVYTNEEEDVGGGPTYGCLHAGMHRWALVLSLSSIPTGNT